MAKERNKVRQFRGELARLQQTIPQDLRLPSLDDNRLEGFAALFVMVLPLLNSEGQTVFSNSHLQELFLVLDQRFGGCLVPSASSHPPYWGLWHPPSKEAAEGEKDYVTTIEVFANPVESSSRFFARLKQILKSAGNIEQQEILISRFDCFLI